jgi:hypothetical protein
VNDQQQQNPGEAAAQPNQFILILQDGDEPGHINVAGAQRPVEHEPTSPSHIVGKFIQDNLGMIINAAVADMSRGLGVEALAGGPTIAVPGEKTIVLPGQDSLAVQP